MCNFVKNHVMKKLLILLIGTLALFSCNGKKTNSCSSLADSLREDSIYKEYAKVAWGDAVFGINTTEALKTNALKDFTILPQGRDYVYDTIMSCPDEKIYDLRAAIKMYNIKKFEAKFNNGELAAITITSEKIPVEQYKDFNSDFEEFNNGIKAKYGIDKSIPLLYESQVQGFSNSLIVSGDYLTAKEKDIECTLHKSEDSFSPEIYYVIDIINYSFPKKKKKIDEKEEAASKEYYRKQDSIRNEMKNNSF